MDVIVSANEQILSFLTQPIYPLSNSSSQQEYENLINQLNSCGSKNNAEIQEI